MTTVQHPQVTVTPAGKRVVKVPRSIIAGAQLQVAMERRLGIETNPIVKKIAAAH